MEEEKNEPFVYNPPKRRAIVESSEDTDRDFREFVRSKFRRSEYRIQKLQQQLARSGQEPTDYDEEEKRRNRRRVQNAKEDPESSNTKKEKSGDSKPQDDFSSQRPPKPPAFSFVARNLHSNAMSRRLTLIANVQRNYVKYIRPPEETRGRPLTSPALQLVPVERQDHCRPYSQISDYVGLYEDNNSTLDSRSSTAYSRSSLGGLGRELPKESFLPLEGETFTRSVTRSYSASCAIRDKKVVPPSISSEEQNCQNSFSLLSQAKTPVDVVSMETEATVAEMSLGDADDPLKKIMAINGAKKFVKKLVTRSKETEDKQDTAKRIREIHRQMGLSQRKRVRSARESSILDALKGNEKFQSEMRVIMESLQEINIRLDKQLNVLNGDIVKTRNTKPLNNPQKIRLKSQEA